MAEQQRPIVAELGRPETPEEAADRRAAASAKRRSNQTLFNLMVATIASLGIVLFLIVVVVRPEPAPPPSVNVAEAARSVDTDVALVVPRLPEGWTANAARFGRTAQVSTWYVGYITPDTQFIALNQGIEANPTWLAQMLDDLEETGTVVLDDITWQLYDNRADANPGNHAFAMSTVAGESTVVLHGTASDAQFQTLALAVSTTLGDR